MPPLLLDLCYILALAIYSPVLAWKMIRRGKYRRSLPASLGMGLRREDRARFAGGSVWVHAVSVGEIGAARALLPEIRRRLGHLPLVVSTTTETGHEQARRLFPDADAVVYFPIDLSLVVRRFQAHYNPRYFFLLETELWPNFLRLLAARGATAVLVNGKLSPASLRRYRVIAAVMRPALDALRVLFVQSGDYVEAMGELSGRPDDVVVAGNVKLDSLPMPLTSERRAGLRRELGLAEQATVLLFGSTHDGEEDLALDVFDQLHAEFESLRLVLCPRHPERFAEVWRRMEEFAAQRAGRGEPVALARASAPPSSAGGGGAEAAGGAGGADLVLLDRMGVLAEAFGIADVAVLGGSFVPVGGHNLLEPAAHGVPVFCGPHMHAQAEIVRLMREADLFLQADAGDLAIRLADLLADPEEREAIGRRGLELIAARRGVGARVFEEMERRGLLEAAPTPAGRAGDEGAPRSPMAP